MIIKGNHVFLAMALLFLGQALAQENHPAAVFLPNELSTGLYERDISISNDGSELYYTIQHPQTGYSQIMVMIKSKKGWSKPALASFSGTYSDLEPFLSPDGKKLYFASNRPLSGTEPKKDFDIWVTERINGKWSNPSHLGNVVNSDQNEFYPSIGKSGTIYFTSTRSNGIGKEDIFMCQRKNDTYFPPVPLDTTINSTGYEFNAFVNAEETLLIFTGYGRADDTGKGDLYLSRKDDKGNWTPAVNMGPSVNSIYLDYCPWLSPDGKTFYFTSERINDNNLYKTKTTNTFVEFLNKAGNGLGDLYFLKWVW